MMAGMVASGLPTARNLLRGSGRLAAIVAMLGEVSIAVTFFGVVELQDFYVAGYANATCQTARAKSLEMARTS